MAKKVLVLVQGEGPTHVYEMTADDAGLARKLLNKAVNDGEWNDEVNTIIDRSKKVKLAGVIDTSGDMFGWTRS